MQWLRLCLLLVVFALVGSCSRKGTPDPIFVGQLAPLSGPEKSLGEHARDAIALAVEERNKTDNLIAGRPFAVLHVDSNAGGIPETAAREAVRLIRVNSAVGLIGGEDTVQAERIGKAIQSYGVPLLTSAGWVAPAAGESLLAFGLTPDDTGRILAKFVLDEWKSTRVATFSDGREPTYTATATAFARELPRAAKTMLVELSFQDEKEWPGLVEKLSSSPPEVVVIATDLAPFLRLRRQLLDKGVKSQLLYGGPDVDKSVLAPMLGKEAPVWYATAFAGEVADKVGQPFAEAFQKKTGSAPDLQAVLAYDSIRVLFDALVRAKLASAAKVREELLRTEEFEGVTGPLSVTKERTVRRNVYVVRVESGSSKIARRYEPGGK